MLSPEISSTASPYSQVFAFVLALAPDCSAGTSTSSCNLTGLLHVLTIVAVILGIILLVVIAFAVHAWRKTKDSDITRS